MNRINTLTVICLLWFRSVIGGSSRWIISTPIVPRYLTFLSSVTESVQRWELALVQHPMNKSSFSAEGASASSAALAEAATACAFSFNMASLASITASFAAMRDSLISRVSLMAVSNDLEK
jgi:hypothetical protein